MHVQTTNDGRTATAPTPFLCTFPHCPNFVGTAHNASSATVLRGGTLHGTRPLCRPARGWPAVRKRPDEKPKPWCVLTACSCLSTATTPQCHSEQWRPPTEGQARSAPVACARTQARYWTPGHLCRNQSTKWHGRRLAQPLLLLIILARWLDSVQLGQSCLRCVHTVT